MNLQRQLRELVVLNDIEGVISLVNKHPNIDINASYPSQDPKKAWSDAIRYGRMSCKHVHWAISNGTIEMVQTLVEYCNADVRVYDTRIYELLNLPLPMVSAVQKNQVGMVHYLLKKGGADASQGNPLSYCSAGSTEEDYQMTLLLLEYGAKVDTMSIFHAILFDRWRNFRLMVHYRASLVDVPWEAVAYKKCAVKVLLLFFKFGNWRDQLWSLWYLFKIYSNRLWMRFIKKLK